VFSVKCSFGEIKYGELFHGENYPIADNNPSQHADTVMHFILFFFVFYLLFYRFSVHINWGTCFFGSLKGYFGEIKYGELVHGETYPIADNKTSQHADTVMHFILFFFVYLLFYRFSVHINWGTCFFGSLKGYYFVSFTIRKHSDGDYNKNVKSS
jgi:hypothetical protein